MKNKMLLAALIAGLLSSAGCSSSAPANSNTTTTTTTNTTTNRATTPTNTSTTTNTSNTSNTTSNTNSSGSSTSQGAEQDFTLVNQTGVEIDQLFVSPANVDDWGPDILGQDTLPSGQSVLIKFSPKEKAAIWDLKVQDKAGNYIQWEDLKLTEINKITLHYNNGKGTADIE